MLWGFWQRDFSSNTVHLKYNAVQRQLSYSHITVNTKPLRSGKQTWCKLILYQLGIEINMPIAAPASMLAFVTALTSPGTPVDENATESIVPWVERTSGWASAVAALTTQPPRSLKCIDMRPPWRCAAAPGFGAAEALHHTTPKDKEYYLSDQIHNMPHNHPTHTPQEFSARISRAPRINPSKSIWNICYKIWKYV